MRKRKERNKERSNERKNEGKLVSKKQSMKRKTERTKERKGRKNDKSFHIDKRKVNKSIGIQKALDSISEPHDRTKLCTGITLIIE